jgi:hypothetical protein
MARGDSSEPRPLEAPRATRACAGSLMRQAYLERPR